jgi:hypothetical protein
MFQIFLGVVFMASAATPKKTVKPPKKICVTALTEVAGSHLSKSTIAASRFTELTSRIQKQKQKARVGTDVVETIIGQLLAMRPQYSGVDIESEYKRMVRPMLPNATTFSVIRERDVELARFPELKETWEIPFAQMVLDSRTGQKVLVSPPELLEDKYSGTDINVVLP